MTIQPAGVNLYYSLNGGAYYAVAFFSPSLACLNTCYLDLNRKTPSLSRTKEPSAVSAAAQARSPS
jgi:hypothetical protein